MVEEKEELYEESKGEGKDREFGGMEVEGKDWAVEVRGPVRRMGARGR